MLQIKDLKIENESKQVLIENANFEMLPNKIIKIRGENGSGKTTLLSSIFKNPNYKIASGDIILNEKSKDAREDIRDVAGIEKMTETNLTNLETQEIVRLGLYLGLQFIPEISGVSTIKFLYKSYQNVHGDKNEFKSIIDFKNNIVLECAKYELDKSFLERDLNYKYSGGEKKIATIIYILALKPKYIFLDEIDSGVDEINKIKIYKIINSLKDSGASILLTSHNSEIDKYINFDRVYKIEDKILK